MNQETAMNILSDTLDLMRQYADHSPPTPKEGHFYRTLNGSIVFVYEVDSDGDASAIILRGGYRRSGHYRCGAGESYPLLATGHHRDDDAGPHLVMTLREPLDLTLPV